jgi:hypothetical protein
VPSGNVCARWPGRRPDAQVQSVARIVGCLMLFVVILGAHTHLRARMHGFPRLNSAAGRASEREGGKERGEMEEKGRGGDLSSDAKTSLI